MIIAYENIPYSQVFVASCINFVGNIIGIMSGRGRVKVGGASTCVDSSVPYSTIARRERSRKLAQRRRDTYKNIMEDLTGVCFKFLRCHVYILRIRYQILNCIPDLIYGITFIDFCMHGTHRVSIIMLYYDIRVHGIYEHTNLIRSIYSPSIHCSNSSSRVVYIK